jgi:methylase of polypeptide subunit release factors
VVRWAFSKGRISISISISISTSIIDHDAAAKSMSTALVRQTNLEQTSKSIDDNLLALEHVVLRSGVAIKKKQAIRHHTQHTILFRWQNERIILNPMSALIGNQRKHFVESDTNKRQTKPSSCLLLVAQACLPS